MLTGGGIHQIQVDVGPLDPESATAWAELRLPQDLPQRTQLAGQIASESDGYPLVISELIRAVGSDGDLGTTSYDTLVRARVADLPDEVQELLQFISLSGVALTADFLAALTDAPLEDVNEALRGLQQRGLVRQDRAQNGRRAYRPFHDRIESLVHGGLKDAQRSAMFRQLFEEASRGEFASPEKLVDYAEAAGDRAEALDQARWAAHEYERRSAFAQLAATRERILGLLEPGDVTWRELAAHGLALQLCGRAGAAAEVFDRAWSVANRTKPTAEMVQVGLAAAQNHLHAGNSRIGIARLRETMQAVGLGRPRTGALALLLAFTRRMGIAVRQRLPSRPALGSEELITWMQTLWAGATGVAMFDHLLSDELGTRHLQLALRTGDTSRILRATGYEAVFLARFGGAKTRSRALRKAHEAERMSEITNLPFDRAWCGMCTGTVHWLGGAWRRAQRHLQPALDEFDNRCRGASWEAVNSAAFLCNAQWYLGDLDGFHGSVARAKDDLDVCGNRYALYIGMFDPLSLAALVVDDARAAQTWVERAEKETPTDLTARFALGHTEARVHLYEQRLQEAWDAVQRGWPDVRRTKVLWVEGIAFDLRYRRATVAAQLYHRSPTSEAAMRKIVLQERKALMKMTIPCAPAMVDTLDASLAHTEGDLMSARTSWRQASEQFLASDMPLYALACRLAECACDPSNGPFAAADYVEQISDRGVTNPVKLVRSLIPAPPLPDHLVHHLPDITDPTLHRPSAR